MLRVGLTGGIGSGKSAVAERLARHGALIIDADRIAREVVEPGTLGLEEIVAEFGNDVLTEDGRLNRPKLGEIVFADSAKLAKLNAIVHPRVGKRTEELMARASSEAVVVYDVPLLVENNLGALYDLVVVVDVLVEEQVARVARDRGMDEDQIRARINAQATRDQRRAAADIVIDNSGTEAELDSKVAELWERLRERS